MYVCLSGCLWLLPRRRGDDTDNSLGPAATTSRVFDVEASSNVVPSCLRSLVRTSSPPCEGLHVQIVDGVGRVVGRRETGVDSQTSGSDLRQYSVCHLSFCVRSSNFHFCFKFEPSGIGDGPLSLHVELASTLGSMLSGENWPVAEP